MNIVYDVKNIQSFQLSNKEQYIIDLFEIYVPICYHDNAFYIFIQDDLQQYIDIFTPAVFCPELYQTALLNQFIYQSNVSIYKQKLYFKENSVLFLINIKNNVKDNIKIQNRKLTIKQSQVQHANFNKLKPNYDIISLIRRENYHNKKDSIYFNELHQPVYPIPFFNKNIALKSIIGLKNNNNKKQKTVSFSSNIQVFGQDIEIHVGIRKGIQIDDSQFVISQFTRDYCQEVSDLFLQNI